METSAFLGQALSQTDRETLLSPDTWDRAGGNASALAALLWTSDLMVPKTCTFSAVEGNPQMLGVQEGGPRMTGPLPLIPVSPSPLAAFSVGQVSFGVGRVGRPTVPYPHTGPRAVQMTP